MSEIFTVQTNTLCKKCISVRLRAFAREGSYFVLLMPCHGCQKEEYDAQFKKEEK